MDEHHEKKDNYKISKVAVWQGISALLGLLLVISLATGGFGLKGEDGTSQIIVKDQPSGQQEAQAPSLLGTVNVQSNYVSVCVLIAI